MRKLFDWIAAAVTSLNCVRIINFFFADLWILTSAFRFGLDFLSALPYPFFGVDICF